VFISIISRKHTADWFFWGGL